MREPEIHSHVTDCLPDEDPRAFKSIECDRCEELLHAANNECMRTWVETGTGNFCLSCFEQLTHHVVADKYGLPEVTDDAAA